MRNLVVLFVLIFPRVVQAQITETFLSENFNGISELPAGWDQETLSSDGGWLIGTPEDLSSFYFDIASADGNIICVNDDACTGCDHSNTFLKLGSVDLSLATNATLQFDIFYFDIVDGGGLYTEALYLEVSLDGGNSWTELLEFTANELDGWQTKTQNLDEFIGESDVKIGFRYTDFGDWRYGAALDNISIVELDPLEVDGVISETSVGVYVAQVPLYYPNYTKAATGKEILPSLTLQNNALAEIVSFDATYSHNGQSYTESVTGISVQSGNMYTYVFNEGVQAVTGANDFTFLISNVNGFGVETNTDNNVGEPYSVEGLDLVPGRIVVYEEMASVNDGYAVGGHVLFPYLQEKYADNFAPIALQCVGPMTNDDYVAQLSGGIVWIGEVYADRQSSVGFFYDLLSFEETLIERASSMPEVLVDNSLEIIFGNVAHVTSNLSFTEDLSGDYNIAIVLVEDYIVGEGEAYDQDNDVFENGQAGPMGGFENFGSFIPAESMVYNRVARAMYPSVPGEANIIPSDPTAGTTVTWTADIDLLGSWEEENIRAITLVIENSTGRIVNAGALPYVVGVEEERPLETSFQIYPNPSTNEAFLTFNSGNLNEFILQVFDANGKRVVEQEIQGFHSGDGVRLNTRQLESGLYTVVVQGESFVAHKKLIVQN